MIDEKMDKEVSVNEGGGKDQPMEEGDVDVKDATKHSNIARGAAL